jgi:hypothetical protein
VGFVAGQAVSGEVHDWRQAPPEHTRPVAHAVPQPPQSFGSVWKLVHRVGAPVTGHWFGSDKLFAQEQVPEMHDEPEMQPFPQRPQLFASVWKLVQRVGVPATGHWFGFKASFAHEQTPETHDAPAMHWFPQLPQLLESLSRLAQYVGLEGGQAVSPGQESPASAPASASNWLASMPAVAASGWLASATLESGRPESALPFTSPESNVPPSPFPKQALSVDVSGRHDAPAGQS